MAPNVDPRPGRPHSYSSPSLPHQIDSAHHSSEATAPSPHPSRTHSHGAVASHFLAQPNDAYGGQTWMDFLRESGPGTTNSQHSLHPQIHTYSESQLNINRRLPPLPHENRRDVPHRTHSSETSAGSADRKRRLTSGESPMRRPSRREHAGSASSSAAPRGSAQNPIVLDSSPAPQRYQTPSSLNTGNGSVGGDVRRGSEFVLPPWQPDAEVTNCFVCGNQFSFFYRKHHCRKCGRVVCAACSPHRITIPRQFIVRPPTELDLTAEDDEGAMSSFGPFRNPALGGGEEVRVCNPCVPDPNYSPPPPYSPFATSSYQQFHPSVPPSQAPISNPYFQGRTRGHRQSHSTHEGAQTIGHGPSSRPRDPFTDRRVSYTGSTSVADLWPPTQPPPQPYDQRARAHTRPLPTSSSSTLPIHPHLDARSMTPSMMRTLQNAAPPSTPADTPPPPPPRRQIPEEDECPICGNELPPTGPDGDDSPRTQHVEACIAIHSGSPPAPPASQTSQSLPAQRTRGMSSAAAAANANPNGEGASNSNRLSMSARGMFPYVATEKDCFDEGGNEAECVICFEEFEAGARMARLVCWCKFHEECIRQWWEKKGRGACPTHQLQF